MKNNHEIIIKVNTYSGYKADERPLSFLYNDLKIEIVSIIERWTGPDHDYFRVQGNDGKPYVMGHDRERDIWHIKAPTINQ